VALGIETVPTRRLLYQLAVLEGDTAGAQRHQDWARSRARGFDLTGALAQVTAFQGRMNDARRLFQQTMDEANRSELSQIANGYSGQLALTDALFGYTTLAIDRGRHLPDSTTYEPQLRAAAALAVAGAVGEAERMVAHMRDLRPSDTLLHATYLPVAEASILLARDRPTEAVDALRPAAPFERGTVAALLPMYFRAEARRRAKAYEDAAKDFRALLQARGGEPFSPTIPLAHLGLARSLAASGDKAGARREYDDLLKIWKDADDDLPVLKQVKTEVAALQN
jgi:tetratricopeptide (TPR) repeat protein